MFFKYLWQARISNLSVYCEHPSQVDIHMVVSNVALSNNAIGVGGGPHELHSLRLLGLNGEVSLRNIVLDAIDAQDHHVLSVTLRLLVALSPALLEYNCFLALRLILDRGVDFGVLHSWSTDRGVVNSANHEHIADTDLLPDREGQELNSDHVVVYYFHLFAIDADDSVDFVGMGGQRDTLLWTMDVDNSVLGLHRHPFGLTLGTRRLLSLFDHERLFPLVHDPCVLFVDIHAPSHFLTRIVVQLLEKGRKHHKTAWLLLIPMRRNWTQNETLVFWAS